MISYDDFAKLEIRIGKILSAERVQETDKLIRLMVDFGEGVPRQIISGIAPFVPDPRTLAGREFPFLTNLEPRMIFGLESQGMILAVGDGETFALLSPEQEVLPGSRVK